MGDIRTQLYRHFDKDGTLLYVGVTASPLIRQSDHCGTSKWGREIATITVEHFDNRRAALAAEWTAIQAEKPRHNIVGRKGAWREPRDEEEGAALLASRPTANS